MAESIRIKWKRWVLPPLGMGLLMLITPMLLLMAIVSTGSSKNQQATSAGGASRCTASWQGSNATLSNLTSTQAEAVRIIYTVAVETGVGAEGAVVGIATAMQESTLGDDPTSRELNSDGDVGLFQQRALVGWYADGATKEANKAILNDHATAARTFFLGHTVGSRAEATRADITSQAWSTSRTGRANQLQKQPKRFRCRLFPTRMPNTKKWPVLRLRSSRAIPVEQLFAARPEGTSIVPPQE